MDVRINTCYVVKIQNQLDVVPDKKTGKLEVYGKRMINDRLMRQTADLCLEALKFCIHVIQEEWDLIMASDPKLRKRKIDTLIHATKTERPKYPEFDLRFQTCLLIPDGPSLRMRLVW